MKKLIFSYDEDKDQITIEGVKYSGDIFRQVGGAFPVGRKFSIIKRIENIDDGTKTVEVHSFQDEG